MDHWNDIGIHFISVPRQQMQDDRHEIICFALVAGANLLVVASLLLNDSKKVARVFRSTQKRHIHGNKTANLGSRDQLDNFCLPQSEDWGLHQMAVELEFLAADSKDESKHLCGTFVLYAIASLATRESYRF